MILLPSDFLKPFVPRNTKPPIGSLTPLSLYLSLEVLNSKIYRYILQCNIKEGSQMPPKRTSTSETPTMTQAAIRQLIADGIAAALEA
ncbi:hypothetical protein Tco_0049621 [Tanacetum coccineum]